MRFFCMGVGVLCLAYFAALMTVKMDFAGIWFLLGLLFLAVGGVGFLEKAGILAIPSAVKWGSGILCLLLLAVFLFVEGKIVGGMRAKGEKEADYVLVLGAQVRGTTPSRALKRRLETACQYLRENPGAKALLSGGKGNGEEITEAKAMEEYLLGEGIDPARLILEDQSTSTVENLKFCQVFLDPGEDKVIIVTNNFHVFRALALARKQGYKRVSGLAAPSEPFYQPHYLMREFFALGKEWAVHNI